MDTIASLGLPREIPLPGKGKFLEAPKQDEPKRNTFGDTLKEFIQDVDQLQKNADLQVERFATGDLKDIHEVMIAAQKANISLQLLVEIRNKMMESYRELMRMQV
jgi:flagellar hook-basal body complex protein FliE